MFAIARKNTQTMKYLWENGKSAYDSLSIVSDLHPAICIINLDILVHSSLNFFQASVIFTTAKLCPYL